jgi:DNA mismatch repair ATPase MutS
MFAIIAASLAWATQLAFAIEGWRARSGPHVPRWLEAVGEFEALAALAAFSAEHPGYTFPELHGEPAHVEATGLAHPLLPESAVANDVRLGGDAAHLWVVSGSNMSGKSTLLRALGVNVVLAQAGAPVRAAAMRLSPLHVGASIRIVDSLQDGKSRFYAEITRLKGIVDLTRAERGAVLFLLDEILAGTNSHDRRHGADGVLTGLTEMGAIGLATTHDLALGEIADRLAPAAANVHFEDVFHDGVLSFDYTLRPGLVRTSNAIALMRSIGLDV